MAATWKERGVVPDSDDDSDLDTEESQPQTLDAPPPAVIDISDDNDDSETDSGNEQRQGERQTSPAAPSPRQQGSRQRTKSPNPASPSGKEKGSRYEAPVSTTHAEDTVWDVPGSSQVTATRGQSPAIPEQRQILHGQGRRRPDGASISPENDADNVWDVPGSSQPTRTHNRPRSVADEERQPQPEPEAEQPRSRRDSLSSLSSLDSANLSVSSSFRRAEFRSTEPQGAPGAGQVASPPVFDLDDNDPLGTDDERTPVNPHRSLQVASDTNGDFDEDEEPLSSIPPELLTARRSFRPRKPIQEHPYLLEQSHYSKLFKSHGVKPLRVRLEEEAARRKAEEDSQEQDYEEDSQSRNGDGGGEPEQVMSQVESGESQSLHDLMPIDDDVDELAPSPVARAARQPHARRRETEVARSHQSDDDEEFPDTTDIAKWKSLQPLKRAATRRLSPEFPKRLKIPRAPRRTKPARDPSPPTVLDDPFDIPPSPPQTSPALFTKTPATQSRRSRHGVVLTPKPSSTLSSRHQSPAPANRNEATIDLTQMPDASNTSDSEHASEDADDNARALDEDRARQRVGKRIRGVLPASWLRIDQHTGAKRPSNAPTRRSPDRSPEKSHRRGVAQRRQLSPGPSTSTPFFFDDSDDNEDTTLRHEDPINNLDDSALPIFDDDPGSDMEDDQIDHMLPASKRSSAAGQAGQRPKKRRKNQQSTFQGQPGQRQRQQRITGLLDHPKNLSSKGAATQTKRSVARPHRSRGGGLQKPPSKQQIVPRLSILDVVEPNAPQFLRVAARAAKRRPDKGKASPTRKHISLGTRRDNIDAAGVLRDWRQGKIPAKIPDPPRTQSSRPEPLQPASPNPLRRLSAPSPRGPPTAKTTSRVLQPSQAPRQVGLHQFVTTKKVATARAAKSGASSRKTAAAGPSRLSTAGPRPAQLEATGGVMSPQAFAARKKALDTLYNKTNRGVNRSLTGPANVRLDNVLQGSTQTSQDQQRREPGSGMDRNTETRGKKPAPGRAKPKKSSRPICIDTTAPQYAHANDPLPQVLSPASERIERAILPADGGKLQGLGAYGTHYTQHFEVFPLDPGVFFHADTLLGSGRIAKAVDEIPPGALFISRSRRNFSLVHKILCWGSWDAQTSSEFGIVLDWVAECLQCDGTLLDSHPTDATRAMDFVLAYIQDHFSLSEDAGAKAFAHRGLEVLRSFAQRMAPLLETRSRSKSTTVDVLGRSLVITMQMLRIVQNLGLSAESFEYEDVLKQTATLCCRALLRDNCADVQALYDGLQERSTREKGIRGDQHAANCWVIVLRVMQEARIPRAGFWDIVTSVLNSDISNTLDANLFEGLWKTVFTLLPLGEFDNTGILIPRIRFSIPLEGWVLPQKILSRVFGLYRANNRQAPSFNDYCRGLVSRCHYLVEQWGWRKSNGVVGTIFDFFASQDLAHLRNEEAFQSPRFLEDLAGSPSLAVLPEDRCFHIFLKLLALSVKRLRESGLTKDVKNLVARVIPNHNRLHDKEHEMRETELAALRNHHDLLCTLFWAAPPEIRPSVQTIEKLVLPASSHKEACFVSLRAWNQLARFVVSSGEDIMTYKPFAEWQRSTFQQMMEQFMSAESDVQRQREQMSTTGSNDISDHFMRSVVKANKKASMDVLHFSLKTILDVLKHTPTLDIASFVLNHYPLEQVFERFSSMAADFDWGCLRVGIDIVDHYTKRIEDVTKHQDTSSGSSCASQEDAILFLDRKIASGFCSMTRTVIRNEASPVASVNERSLCVERSILISSHIAACLVQARVLGVSRFLKPGRYNIFDELPKSSTAPSSRRLFPLFLAALLEKGVNFKDLGPSVIELFMCAIVKPRSYLRYEGRLAQAMKNARIPCLEGLFVDVAHSPDYNSNRDMFSHTISNMRKALRSATASEKTQLQSESSKAIKAVMDQMKADLRLLTSSPPEHSDYIEFVRSIITLIRFQDVCPVDNFFYQISAEFSPSAQDPHLHTAAILAHGLKLEDGDTKSISSLFYLLFNNFKLALANDKLADQREILHHGMMNPHVFSFMLSHMFPAVLGATARHPDAWVLLDTYVGALEAFLDADCVHREIDDVAGLLTTLQSASLAVRGLADLDTEAWCPQHLSSLVRLAQLLNLLSPSIETCLINQHDSPTAGQLPGAIDTFSAFAQPACDHLADILGVCDTQQAAGSGATRSFFQIDPVRLCEGIRQRLPLERQTNDPTMTRRGEQQIAQFTSHMVRDIAANWTAPAVGRLTVRGPAGRQSAASQQQGGGTVVPPWDAKSLARELEGRLEEWNDANPGAEELSGREAGANSRKPGRQGLRLDVFGGMWY